MAATSLQALHSEALRLRQEVMAEVGLGTAQELQSHFLSTLSKTAPSRKRQRREEFTNEGSRRSGRLASLPTRNFNEDDLANATQAEAGASASSSSGSRAASSPSERNGLIPPPSAPPAPSPGSSKGLPCRIPWLNDRLLGRFIPMRFSGMAGNQAKRAVMQAACGAPGGSKNQVKFNKYSGAQEWANGIILFANMSPVGVSAGDADEDGGKASGFANAFLEGGRRFAWFASTAAHDNSAVVLRLINHEKGAKISLASESSEAGAGAGSGSEAGPMLDIKPCPVALVVRLSSNLPYVYCGELFYASHVAGSRPLRFEFTLKHADKLLSEVAKAGTAALDSVVKACTASLPPKGFELEQAQAAGESDVERAYAEPGQRGMCAFAAVLKAGGVHTL